jgi:hypothetical protein
MTYQNIFVKILLKQLLLNSPSPSHVKIDWHVILPNNVSRRRNRDSVYYLPNKCWDDQDEFTDSGVGNKKPPYYYEG